ncbi:hypothetical protein ASF60_19200 [Methylobacterium sp. Leaf113]|uniref:hypothetical protein n=1 Tax=Methylobacterium sp. Leaf113 TaxID=1736259 RepID=UPI0006FDF8BD|nr:hypothetical protein [Methylobacterium sp. Leaf113]KQP89615.1 hypothetical protein ASF60_19200 [Methylobacterium sp. Leaf113]
MRAAIPSRRPRRQFLRRPRHWPHRPPALRHPDGPTSASRPASPASGGGPVRLSDLILALLGVTLLGALTLMAAFDLASRARAL